MRRFWTAASIVRFSSLALALTAIGCSDPARSLRVVGPTPFVRCLAAEPAAPRQLRVGRATLQLKGRRLAIEGLGESVRVAVFSGPAFHEGPMTAQLDALRAANADFILLVGDLGDQPAIAGATLTALATLPAPILVLCGGRDSMRRVADAIASVPAGAERIFDISALTHVRVAGHDLLPLAGAYEGHYALGDQGCGYDRADLVRQLSEPGGEGATHTHVIAWEQPPGWPVADEPAMPDQESPGPAEVAALARRADAIFAWPAVARPPAGAPLRAGEMLSVPALTGTAQHLDDGTRLLPGFLMLHLDRDGLRIGPI